MTVGDAYFAAFVVLVREDVGQFPEAVALQQVELRHAQQVVRKRVRKCYCLSRAANSTISVDPASSSRAL